MTGTTAWVRKAMAELGPDAPDQQIKAYIRMHAPEIRENQIGLALRKLRGPVIPVQQRRN